MNFKAKLIISLPVPPALLVDSAGRIVRELWWTNQYFLLSLSFRYGCPCSYIT
jgi:hypothetical protein